jgi:two-component system NtrC family sensor kinase
MADVSHPGAGPPRPEPRRWTSGLARRAGQALASALFGRDLSTEILADRERLTAELARRHAELYSLQELAHVLSASLRFERVVAEVARYAMRALDASGAAVLLAPPRGGALEVAAAKGVLAPHLRRTIDPESGGMVLEAIAQERLARRTTHDGAPFQLFEGATVRSAIAAPLRAHGLTSGAIVVADRLSGDFTEDDARLLSTAATHAAVVLANARFFELIRAGKEEWEGTFDALAAGVALVDRSGRVLRANAAIANLADEPLPRIIGRDLDGLLFGERPGVGPLIRSSLESGRTATGERRTERRGRILRVSASPVPASEAQAEAVVIVEDITEQKTLEAQLLQSEKLASVGTLVSGVAHELNNPLTSIAGLSELLLEQGIGTTAQQEHLKVINDQAERASRIVRNLLAFARKGESERTQVDLGEIAQRTVMLMAYELRRVGVTVHTDVAPDLPTVAGNRDQLQQVVLNLLTNAAYALNQLPEGAERRVEVAVASDAEGVSLTVRDTGPGVPAEFAAQVFDPFFTTKPPGEGTGLGLFLSFGIAEAHGGTLMLDSPPGRGATFTLRIPFARVSGEHPAIAAARATPAPGTVRTSRRILVVDEDPGITRVVSVLFTHDGHAVDAVAAGQEAQRLVGEREYDLLIVDRRVAVGGESCWEVLVREHPALAPRLLVSTSDRAVGPLGGIPAERVLQKPFNLRDLRAAASAVWAAAR